jgi:hypothetical protein
MGMWRLRTIGENNWGQTTFFMDLKGGIVDVSMLVKGPDAGVFEGLRDPAFFATAYLDCGTVTWPNGADLAPDAMYKEIRRCGVWRILD